MGRPSSIAIGGALIVMLTLAGCGSSSTSQSTSASASSTQTTAATTGTRAASDAPGKERTPKEPAQKEHLPKVTLLVASPAFTEGDQIATRYTCDGTDTSPPVQWRAIPRGTTELALFVLNLNSPSGSPLPIYWAVAGLHPTLKGIPPGRLPPGAIVGRNSLGQNRYTICPAKSEGVQHYVVALFAIQHHISATPGFNASTFYRAVSGAAEFKGLTGFSYQRG
jgi:phosphatidylethanolamine-binding protein (PEBP) family uncharacterized protein